jgi:hypothetical protein
MLCQRCKKNVSAANMHICPDCDTVVCFDCSTDNVCPNCLSDTNLFS